MNSSYDLVLTQRSYTQRRQHNLCGPVCQGYTGSPLQGQSQLTRLVERNLDETGKSSIDYSRAFNPRFFVNDAAKVEGDARIPIVIVPPIYTEIGTFTHEAQSRLS